MIFFCWFLVCVLGIFLLLMFFFFFFFGCSFFVCLFVCLFVVVVLRAMWLKQEVKCCGHLVYIYQLANLATCALGGKYIK